MKVDFSKGFYYEKDYYWQCVFIPSITFLSSKGNAGKWYYCLTFEWLFWNYNITISKNEKLIRTL